MTGMMWHDDSEISFEAKIQKAASYYGRKYGQMPTLCQVHPSMVDGDIELIIDGIRVEPQGGILKDHFFLTVEGT